MWSHFTIDVLRCPTLTTGTSAATKLGHRARRSASWAEAGVLPGARNTMPSCDDGMGIPSIRYPTFIFQVLAGWGFKCNLITVLSISQYQEGFMGLGDPTIQQIDRLGVGIPSTVALVRCTLAQFISKLGFETIHWDFRKWNVFQLFSNIFNQQNSGTTTWI